MASVKDRLKRLESQVKQDPQLSSGDWFLRMMSDPEVEDCLNASFFLAYADIIEKPPAHIWQQLFNRLDRSPRELGDSLLTFYLGFLFDKNDEESAEIEEWFEAEDAKHILCEQACIYYDAFKEAPFTGDTAEMVKRRWLLGQRFVIPFLTFSCPEIKGYGDATYFAWMDSVVLDENDQLPDGLLESLRDYAKSLK